MRDSGSERCSDSFDMQRDQSFPPDGVQLDDALTQAQLKYVPL
jgi:hypothetical protein